MSSTQFEVLEHTADIGIRAFGTTLEELFANAAVGVEDVAFDVAAIRALQSYQLEASGEDVEALLVNWINELIYWFDARRIGFSRFEVSFPSDGIITVNAWGEPRDAERHPARLVVKASTYHLLRVDRTPDGWIAELYLDI